MKVLRVAHHGVVSAWRERERELRRQGVEVTLISARMWNEGGRNVRVDASSDAFVRPAATLGRHPNAFLYDPRVIWRALAQRPDVIDLHEEPCALATAEVLLLRLLRARRVPYLLYSAQNIPKRYPIPFRWFERLALRGAAGVSVCNDEAGRILRAKGLRAPAPTIGLGVDLAAFHPGDSDVAGPRVRVGYVGRLEAHKGVDVLIEAVRARPDWDLEITGDGPWRGRLEEQARRAGIADRVVFAGHAQASTLAQRYRRMDVLAVPSRPTPGWLEQFCRVAVEAMASGVPVVASQTGAIPEVVADAGILVDPDDPQALTTGIEQALQPETAARLRQAGPERARCYTWHAVAAQHRDLYHRALADGDASAPPQVLVVAYGPPDGLDRCLSVLGEGHEVTVVDNSSSAETAAVARRWGAHYLDAGGNRGFAGGVNLGLRVLYERFGAHRDVLLLNPDARLAGAAVDEMVRELHAHPRTAAVGATQTDPATGRPVRVWWPFPTPWGAWIEAVGLSALRRRRDFAIGSALMLNAAALEQLGLLDERFFLYAEEVDWQYRARRHGWDIRVAEVEATHEGAGTGGDPRVREGHFHASGELYIRKHYGVVGWQVHRAANIVAALVRAVLLPGSRGAAARRRVRLYALGPVRARDGRAEASEFATRPGCT